MLLLLCFHCWMTLIKIVLLYLHHVPARNAHGTRERKERKTQSACPAQNIKQKERKVQFLWLISILDQQSTGRSGNNRLVDFFMTCNLSTSKSDEISMWETQLQFLYDDYQLDEIDVAVLTEKIKVLCQYLTVKEVMQLLGTEEQSQCQKWYSER